MRKIRLKSGKYTFIDDDVHANYILYKWYEDTCGYAVRYTRKNGIFSTIRIHREIMGLPYKKDKLIVDHINGNKLDNRRENLRICTQSFNCQNRRKKEQGVNYHKASGKWQARITKDGKTYQIGLFKLKKDAIEEYQKMAKKLYWE